jgi:hypothetical protein
MSNTVSSGAICTVVAFKRPGSRFDGESRGCSLRFRESAKIPPDDGVAGCAELQ